MTPVGGQQNRVASVGHRTTKSLFTGAGSSDLSREGERKEKRNREEGRLSKRQSKEIVERLKAKQSKAGREKGEINNESGLDSLPTCHRPADRKQRNRYWKGKDGGRGRGGGSDWTPQSVRRHFSLAPSFPSCEGADFIRCCAEGAAEMSIAKEFLSLVQPRQGGEHSK